MARTVPYTALYHVMREQGALVAPRSWAEEGVGRANLNEHEKPTVLRLKWRREHPDPGPAQGGGASAGLGKKERTAPHPVKNARNTTNNPKTKTLKPYNAEKKMENNRGAVAA